MKLDEVIAAMEETWGGLPIRSVDYGVSCFDRALQKTFTQLHQHPLARSVAQLMVEGLRAKNLRPNDHASLDDLTTILRTHQDKGTALYVFTGSWAHHAPSDHCEGSDGDYCEHECLETASVFEAFADASHYAWEALNDKLVPECPNSATNARCKIHMNDGDDLIPLGQWTWDKFTSAIFWLNPERH